LVYYYYDIYFIFFVFLFQALPFIIIFSSPLYFNIVANRNDESLSIQTIKMFFIGVASGNSMGVVDVRDVAEAQLRAAENNAANGR
jgi:hypothetical protein